jgi:BlaI family penicillinase repressor
MKRAPKISENEWRIMKIIWAQAPCSAGDIIQALGRTGPDWHPKTIKTFLNRLVSKKVLGYSKVGRAYRYRPLFNEQECVEAPARAFWMSVWRIAQADAGAFLSSARSCPKEIAELKRILEEGAQ